MPASATGMASSGPSSSLPFPRKLIAAAAPTAIAAAAAHAASHQPGIG